MFNKNFFSSTLLSTMMFLLVLSACSQQNEAQVQLPEKAAQAINKAVPGGKITAVKKETEEGKELYEVVVTTGDKTFEIDVLADGKIESREVLTAGGKTENEEKEEKSEEETVLNFDASPVGRLPADWSNQKTGRGGLGKWEVLEDATAPSAPNVLAQLSKENPGYHFNVAVAEKTSFSDVKIELKFKAVDGQEDQGGGPVWRYQDADNYYICRANPLENNFRLYKVVDGNRKQLQSASVKIPSNVWHSIKIENIGNQIKCWYDGKLYLEFTDDTFTSGKVGLWTKADAVTYFDDFEVEKAEKEE